MCRSASATATALYSRRPAFASSRSAEAERRKCLPNTNRVKDANSVDVRSSLNDASSDSGREGEVSETCPSCNCSGTDPRGANVRPSLSMGGSSGHFGHATSQMKPSPTRRRQASRELDSRSTTIPQPDDNRSERPFGCGRSVGAHNETRHRLAIHLLRTTRGSESCDGTPDHRHGRESVGKNTSTHVV